MELLRGGMVVEGGATLPQVALCVRRIELKYEGESDLPVFVAPRVGCGFGRLTWEKVKIIFENSKLNWKIYYI